MKWIGKRSRRILKILGWSIAGLLGVLLSLPVWFPWLLRPLARGQHIQYRRYERLGYSRFAVSDVVLSNQTLRIRADNIQGFVPSVWLWRRKSEETNALFLTAQRYEIEILSGGETNGPSRSVQDQVREVFGVLRTVQRWLPTAALSNGTIRVQTSPSVPALRTLLELPWAVWSQGELRAQANVGQPRTLSGLPTEGGHSLTNRTQEVSAFPEPATRILSPYGTNPIPVLVRGKMLTTEYGTDRSGRIGRSGGEVGSSGLELALESAALSSHCTLSLGPSSLTLQSTSRWLSNRIDINARFAAQGILPESASLQATNCDLPADLTGLRPYGSLTGALSASWEKGRFGLDLKANARPPPTQTDLPPLEAQLHAYGDTNSATIESALITSPWLRAELPRHLQLSFSGPLLREPARAKVAVDLDRQPWVALQGKLSGEVDLRPDEGKVPAADFRLSGSQVGERGTPRGDKMSPPRMIAENADLEGSVRWPVLELGKVTARFQDGSVVSGAGSADLEKSELAHAQVQFSGPLGRRWLPDGYNYQALSLKGSVHGPFTNLAYNGHLEATNVSSPVFQASRLRADWDGQGTSLEHVDLGLFAGNSELHAQAKVGRASRPPPASLGTPTTAARAESEVSIQVAALSLLTNSQELLDLSHPCRLSIATSASNLLVLSPFDWVGPNAGMHVEGSLDWPAQGHASVTLSNLSSTLFAGFFKTNLAPLELVSLKAEGGWTNGPLTLDLVTSLTLREGEESPVQAQVQLRADAGGIFLSNLLVNSQTSAVASAHGFLPVTFRPGASTNGLGLDLEKPLRLSASAAPHAFFWDTLAQWSGLRLQQPDLKVDVSGTLAEPQGAIDLQAQQVLFSGSLTNLPSVQQVRLLVELDRQRARLTKGRFLVQGQPVALTGDLPLGQPFWRELREKKLPDWDQATAHLEMERAPIAAFEPLFPGVLAPVGEIGLRVSLLRGGKLEGDLNVSNARTQPLGVAGPIRDIELKMNFRERALELQSLSATLGGAPLRASGQADLSGAEWMAGTVPPFQFKLIGTNVPLSRQPGSIIRSDLNLSIIKTNSAVPALITGAARLRDSVYLSDIAALVPGREVASPSQRPPYFSIEQAPLADWRLAVRVEGARFLKVRTSLFNGEVSTLLNLQGTLEDPIALGDVRIDSGLVRFPFASLQVQQGFVTLTSQDPYHPQVSLRANSKQYGYDIRMEVTGPADAPILQFSSTPPLASDQILLMITAGELPKGEFTLTPQQKAETVAVFLGRDLLGKLGFSDSAEQRLTIRSGEDISVEGRPTYHAEYKLSDRWALEGEYDRFGDFNAGFKWRIYSK